MKRLTILGVRKAPSRKFVPSGAGFEGTGLEPRQMAAAMLWRYPMGNPDRNDYVSASVDPAPYDGPHDSYAYDDGTEEADDFDQGGNTQVVLAGVATSVVHDLDDPAYPTAPVGNSSICIDSSIQLSARFSGTNLNVNAFNNAHTVTSRAYLLAEDSSPTGNTATLVEHYDVHISYPTDGSISPDFYFALNTPSLQIDGYPGYVEIDGSGGLSPGSGTLTGTFTGTLGTVSYSFSANDLHVTATTSVGVLPTIEDSSGTLQGTAWYVQSTLDSYAEAQVPMSGATSASATITSHYSAYFTAGS